MVLVHGEPAVRSGIAEDGDDALAIGVGRTKVAWSLWAGHGLHALTLNDLGNWRAKMGRRHDHSYV